MADQTSEERPSGPDFSFSAEDEEAMRQLMPAQFGKTKPAASTTPQRKGPEAVTLKNPAAIDPAPSATADNKASAVPQKDVPASPNPRKRKRRYRGIPPKYNGFLRADNEPDPDKAAKIRQDFQISLVQSFSSTIPSDSEDSGPHNGEYTPPLLSSSEEEEDPGPSPFPLAETLQLKTHEKAVTTLTLDSSGNRLVTGSRDCSLKFHDLASLTPNSIYAFKTVDPSALSAKHPSASSQQLSVGGGSSISETHQILKVAFNPHTSSQLLSISATSSQAKILDRDGNQLVEFLKGDMYLRDLSNTKGHIAEICGGGCWSPVDRSRCLTGGADSTVRIWDVETKRAQIAVLNYKSKAAGSGGRSRITAVAWGTDPIAQGPQDKGFIVAAAQDGGMAVWSPHGPLTRPSLFVTDAHKPGTWTASIAINADGRTFVTKGGDEDIKLWDARKLKLPITATRVSPPHPSYLASDIAYSPNSDYVFTGMSNGYLLFVNPGTLRIEKLISLTPKDVPILAVQWHPVLNQIAVGCADGTTRILYDPETSKKGAVDIMARAPRRRHIDDSPSLTTDIAAQTLIDSNLIASGPQSAREFAMGAAARHPTVGLTVSGRPRDPRRPKDDVKTPWGNVQPDEEHVRRSIPLSSMREEDPREALLKYADKAKDDPIFTKAWSKTQPVTQYKEIEESAEDETGQAPGRKRFKR